MRLLSEISHFRNRWPTLAGIVLAIVALVALTIKFAAPLFRHENPLLTTPKLALEALSARTLYYNGPARPWLLSTHPELISEEDRKDPNGMARSFAQAVQDPKLFRQLDRQYRFDTILLVGSPSQYHPLLEHLLETPDWTLTYVDHTSLIFKRGSADRWTPAKLEPLRATFAQPSANDRATFLAQTARKLMATRNSETGRSLAEEAQKVDPKSAEGWSAMAEYYLNRGEWNPAIGNADHALELDHNSLTALAVKSQALYATKHFADAYHVSDKLMEKVPDDPGLLFYHAKICHEARAFGEEIKALDKLIAMAEANHRPTSGYNVYLGQAYARSGKGQEALAAYASALEDPDLPKSQREEVLDAVELVRSHLGKK